MKSTTTLLNEIDAQNFDFLQDLGAFVWPVQLDGWTLFWCGDVAIKLRGDSCGYELMMTKRDGSVVYINTSPIQFMAQVMVVIERELKV